MTAPAGHRGQGNSLADEFLIRQVLLEGFPELAGDDFRLEELFRRLDDLRHGTQDQWTADMVETLKGYASGDMGRIEVILGYPEEVLDAPVVAVLLESGAESQAGATAGDRLGDHFERRGTEVAGDPASSHGVIRHRVIGTAWTRNVQVSTWAPAPELSLLVHAAVVNILFRDKAALLRGGVLDVSFSETGFEPDPARYPNVRFCPVLRCTMDGQLRQTRRQQPVPVRAKVKGATFEN